MVLEIGYLGIVVSCVSYFIWDYIKYNRQVKQFKNNQAYIDKYHQL